jgi:hypothetical protein
MQYVTSEGKELAMIASGTKVKNGDGERSNKKAEKSDEKEEREDKFKSVVAGSRKMTGLYKSSAYLNSGCDRRIF